MKYKRVYGPTPNGGDYSEIYFLDRANNIVDSDQAFHCIIRECKKDGTLIQEIYGIMPENK